MQSHVAAFLRDPCKWVMFIIMFCDSTLEELLLWETFECQVLVALVGYVF